MKNTSVKWLMVYALILNAFSITAQTGDSSPKLLFKKDFAPQEGLIKDVEKPYRDELCINGYWQFSPVILSKSISIEEIKTPQLPEKINWEKELIKIPSPWNVNGFTNGQGGDFRTYPGYPEKWENIKAGWLKRTINIPADWAGNSIILHFEAIAGYTKIFVNGVEVGENFDSFLPFNVDITNHAKPGQETEILVWVAHGSLLDKPGQYGYRNYVAGSFWGKHIAGIWQDVYLQKIPNVYVTDTYVKSWVDKDELEIDITVKNASSKEVKFHIEANIRRWLNLNGKSITDIPDVKWTLGETALTMNSSKLQINPNEQKVFTLSVKVNGALNLWTPGSPNLYGLVLTLNQKNVILDKKYSRFGWRQFKIEGTQFLLNGKPIQIKGDSWHFMGVPQMTRRYAYAWYQMLLDANANGLRLHAQVFPRFYLEMADEMGICVLDETAIWSSDGGPKIDSEIYWGACRKHVKGLIMRDRNHPSVFGWSVCNETLPVTKHVFNAPPELIEKNIQEINNWVTIAKETDPTRTWISGDGETQEETILPTVIGHYGGNTEMERWSKQNNPWGIGETGMAYYGTPAQVSTINGDRAFESQQGRMEGLAGEAFELISKQRNRHASYTSIFNLAWYSLKPLELGLSDISRSPELSDGVFFSEYVEGKPGYQPERLGPYSSTFNPGYDPTLPLYKSWPLFDAVRAAFSDNYLHIENTWKEVMDNTVQTRKYDEKEQVVWLSGSTRSELKDKFQKLALKFNPLSANKDQLILVDGANPPLISSKLVLNLKAAMQNGSSLLFWGANENSKELIEAITGSNIDFYERGATSYIIKGKHPLLNGQSNASLYFSEMTKQPISTSSIGGNWVEKSQLILEACNTDWQKWNYNGESIKTARVYRNEREAKAPGNVIVRQPFGMGEIVVSTVDFFAPGNKSRYLVSEMLTNLGGTFKGDSPEVLEAIDKDGILINANFYGSVKNDSREIKLVFTFAPLTEEEFTRVKLGTATKGQYWDILSANPEGVFDFQNLNLKHKNYASAYLSFWIYSPRSLTDLLIEPNMPRLDMHFGVDDALAFSINGNPVKEYLRESGFVEDEITFEGVPLEKGWNHILIKVGQQTGEWKCRVRFSCTNTDFLKKVKSSIDK